MLSAQSAVSRCFATLEAIRDADYHRPGLVCRPLFRVLPAFFAEIREDALRLHDATRPSEIAQADHVSNWISSGGRVFQYSLFNRSGHLDDAASDHDASCLGKRFSHAAGYPSLARLIGLFRHCINFRLNGLAAGARLTPHEEHVTFATRSGRIGVRARFHLPILTNERAEMVVAGDVFHFAPGTIYFFNNGCVHSARNFGDELRLHLVWDMLMTEEAAELMFGQAAPSGLERIAAADASLAKRRTEPIGEYTTHERFVERAAAKALQFCDEQ